ncbi:hypothetical protein KsCSTR_24800 [Candidatus Kuenenia stuttgartiensis]|uniref:Uncharacterized protein n=2 Tax=Kuenenia stuttgartiensis TaxID=174633 RepID=A0A6G7GQJ5_KUEST|nr:hypothetical protein KsCSTR_24800 [Candidatus Kuenenia stuttgartiensis]
MRMAGETNFKYLAFIEKTREILEKITKGGTTDYINCTDKKIKYSYFTIKYFAKKHALTNGSVQRNY